MLHWPQYYGFSILTPILELSYLKYKLYTVYIPGSQDGKDERKMRGMKENKWIPSNVQEC